MRDSARDSPDDEEKEVLSSTSTNVREIWNGNRVVRQTGGSKTTMLIWDENQVSGPTVGHGVFFYPACLSRFHEPSINPARQYRVRDKLGRGKEGKTREQPPSGITAPAGYDSDSEDPAPSSRDPVADKVPPNLTVNISHAIPPKSAVWVMTCVGLLVQATVMVINALMVYHWKLLRAGKIVASYGYPTWAVGTIAITVGTWVCGRVVQSSCWKVVLEPARLHSIVQEQTQDGSADNNNTREKEKNGKEKKKPLRVIFLQSEIPEQQLPAYAIEPIKPGGDVVLSRRLFPPSPDTEYMLTAAQRAQTTKLRSWSTAAGTGLALCGFVCQNVGTRELHYSAGLLQLVATLILTLLRAWLRQRVGDGPGRVMALQGGGNSASHLSKELTTHQAYMPVMYGISRTHFASYGDEMRQIFQKQGEFLMPIDLPWLDYPDAQRISSTDHDAPSQVVLGSILKAQAWLADCELDSNGDVKLAANICRALEDMLTAIGFDRSLLELLDEVPHLVYLLVHKDASKSTTASGPAGTDTAAEESEPDLAPALVSVSFPTNFTDHDQSRFLAAIISLTRCEYAGWAARGDDEDKKRSSIFRIVGRCKYDHVEDYANLLRTWVNHPGTLFCRDRRSWSRVIPSRSALMQRQSSLVFGLALSAKGVAADPSSSTAADGSSIENNLKNSSDSADVEFVLEDEQTADRSAAICRNIVLELVSSFLLQAITHVGPEVVRESLMGTSSPGRSIAVLVDILLKNGVCRSEAEARLAVVPALVSHDLLPAGESTRPWRG